MPGLSAQDVANKIRRCRDTVLRWAAAGLIPCKRFNKRRLVFDWDRVKEAMEENNLKEGGK